MYHRSLGERLAEALLSVGAEVLVSIDDGSSVAQLPGAVALDEALSSAAAVQVAGSPDDLIMMCTGGTTGRPKGVLWRQSDMYVAAMAGADHASVDEIRQKVRGGGQPWFAVSPLMHAAGMWTAFAAILNGLSVILYDNRTKLDPRSVWETAAREKVGMLTMVGDAYAGPLVAELRRGATTCRRYMPSAPAARPPTTSTSRR
ncbi:AMP-binding enzyme family protein [Mycobacterium xenopi 3993]|nr:AMP-binding enzyme family protein [Mycobacterium xenopi 3993]